MHSRFKARLNHIVRPFQKPKHTERMQIATRHKSSVPVVIVTLRQKIASALEFKASLGSTDTIARREKKLQPLSLVAVRSGNYH